MIAKIYTITFTSQDLYQTGLSLAIILSIVGIITLIRYLQHCRRERDKEVARMLKYWGPEYAMYCKARYRWYSPYAKPNALIIYPDNLDTM